MISTYKVSEKEVNYTWGIQGLVDDIYFNWYSLQNQYIISSAATWDSISTRYQETPAPRSDWEIFLSRFFTWEDFTLNVLIKWDTRTDFQSRVDEFSKRVLNQEEWLFHRKMPDWSFRYKKCSVVSRPVQTNHYNNTFITFQITFWPIDPFWIWEVNQSELFSWITLNPFSFSYEPQGSANTLPIIYIIMQSGNAWITGFSIETQDQLLSYATAISDNDIITVNSEDVQTTTINWTQVFPDWWYPTLGQRQNQFIITMTWASAVNYDVTITNKIKYF